MKIKKPRVAILSAEVAGYGGELVEGFKELGIDAKCYFPYTYSYEGSTERAHPAPCTAARKVHRLGESLRGWKKVFCLPLKFVFLILKLCILIRVYLTRDEIISLSGRSMVASWEWNLAPLFGCRVTVIFLGTESRPYYLGGNVVGRDCGANPADVCLRTLKQKHRIGLIEKKNS